MHGKDNLVPFGDFQHLFTDDTPRHGLCEVLNDLSTINFIGPCAGVVNELPLALGISYLPDAVVVDVQPVG